MRTLEENEDWGGDWYSFSAYYGLSILYLLITLNLTTALEVAIIILPYWLETES